MLLFWKIIEIQIPLTNTLENLFHEWIYDDLEDRNRLFNNDLSKLAVRFIEFRTLRLMFGFLEFLSFHSDIQGSMKWRRKIVQQVSRA